MSEFVIKCHSKVKRNGNQLYLSKGKFYTLHLRDGIYHQILGRFKTRKIAEAAKQKYLRRLNER